MAIDYSSPVDITALTAAIAAPLQGHRIQWGTFTLTVGTSAAVSEVTFPEAFASTPRVFCTVVDTGAPGNDSVNRWGSSSGGTDGAGTTTKFWFQGQRGSGSFSVRVNWFAIGL